MTEQKYNGWTNYETWRVALENFDGFDCDGVEYSEDDLQDLVIEHLENEANGLALDYALAFISKVNWYEIAQHLNSDN